VRCAFITAFGFSVYALTALTVAQAPSSDPALAALLARAGRAADTWVTQFSAVVAEERLVQEGGSSSRSLGSDVLLVKLNESGQLFQFRDVFEVDKRAVRNRQGRLEALFVGSPATALEQAAQIDRASSAYNLRLDQSGDQPMQVQRPFHNMPFAAVGLLQTSYQSRFRFTRDGPDRRIERGVAVVQYEESTRPTLFGSVGDGASARDIVAKGRFWLDAESGRATRAELRLDYLHGGWDIVVTSFTFDSSLQLTVPSEMRTEHYFGRAGSLVRGHATYTRFRRFTVQTDERLSSGPKAKG